MVTIEKVMRSSAPPSASKRQPKKRVIGTYNLKHGGAASSLAFKNLIATEVVEDDIVCGIEIAPCTSDGVSTISTAQISTDQSESSWSLERDEGSDEAVGEYAFRTREMRYKRPLSLPYPLESYESYEHLILNSPSSSLSEDQISNDAKPYSFHSRIESLLKELDDDSPQAQPMFMLRFECVDYEEDFISKGAVEDPECVTDTSDQRRAQPLNLSAELAFQSMISATHKRLCQLDLSTADVPFLCDGGAESNATISAPFMMFPEKSTVIVSQDGPGGNYTVSSRGPLAGGVLAHLLDIQGNINGRRVNIQSFAFRDKIPPYVGCEPIPLDASTVRFRLNNWRRSNKKKLEQFNNNNNLIITTTTSNNNNKQTRALIAAAPEQHPLTTSLMPTTRTRLICPTQMLSFVSAASPPAEPSDDESITLFHDDELRAMMDITQDGDNVSALFPSFSSDTASDFMSDDGLGDEIGALDEINIELRKELAIADILLKDQPIPSPESWDRRYDDEATSTTEEDEGTITTTELETVSLTDQQSTQPDHPIRITILKGSRYFPSDRIGVRRRVRFAEYNDEFIFISDPPSTRSRRQQGEAHQQSETPEWVHTLEDVYYLFEDFMDDLGYSCAQALERNRPRPSPNKPTRASTAYYV